MTLRECFSSRSAHLVLKRRALPPTKKETTIANYWRVLVVEL